MKYQLAIFLLIVLSVQPIKRNSNSKREKSKSIGPKKVVGDNQNPSLPQEERKDSEVLVLRDNRASQSGSPNQSRSNQILESENLSNKSFRIPTGVDTLMNASQNLRSNQDQSYIQFKNSIPHDISRDLESSSSNLVRRPSQDISLNSEQQLKPDISSFQFQLEQSKPDDFEILIPDQAHILVPDHLLFSLSKTTITNFKNPHFMVVENQKTALASVVKEYYLVHDYHDYFSPIPKIIIITKDSVSFLLTFDFNKIDNKPVPYAFVAQIPPLDQRLLLQFKLISRKENKNDRFTLNEMFTKAKEIAESVELGRFEGDQDLEKLLINRFQKQITEKNFWKHLSYHIIDKLEKKRMNRLGILFKFLRNGLSDPVLPQIYQLYALKSFFISEKSTKALVRLQSRTHVLRWARIFFPKILSPKLTDNRAFVVVKFDEGNLYEQKYLVIQGQGDGLNREKLLKTSIHIQDDRSGFDGLLSIEGTVDVENIFKILERAYHLQLNSGLWIDKINELDTLKSEYTNKNVDSPLSISTTIKKIQEDQSRVDPILYSQRLFNQIAHKKKQGQKDLFEIFIRSQVENKDPSSFLLKKKNQLRKRREVL